MSHHSHKSSTAPNKKPARSEAGRPLNPGDEAAPGTPGTGEDVCPRCRGSGRLDGVQCPDCDGTGRIVEGIGGG